MDTMKKEEILLRIKSGGLLRGREVGKNTPFSLIDMSQKGTDTCVMIETDIVRDLLADGSIVEVVDQNCEQGVHVFKSA